MTFYFGITAPVSDVVITFKYLFYWFTCCEEEFLASNCSLGGIWVILTFGSTFPLPMELPWPGNLQSSSFSAGMVTSMLPWGACSNAQLPFQWGSFFLISSLTPPTPPPPPAPVQLVAISPVLSNAKLCAHLPISAPWGLESNCAAPTCSKKVISLGELYFQAERSTLSSELHIYSKQLH